MPVQWVPNTENTATMAQANPRSNVGDKAQEIALRYAQAIDRLPVIAGIGDGTTSKAQYLAFIASMYPIVVGFNRALTLSMTKLDNVRESAHIKAISIQLREEQEHNQMWREMLEAHGIDHKLIYSDLQAFLSRTEPDRLTALTEEFVASRSGDGDFNGSTVFKDCPFPDAIAALHHYMWMTGALPRFHYLEHYASQLAMEVVIGYTVTRSIGPGVIARSELSIDGRAINWWTAHTLNCNHGAPSEEEKHIQLAVHTLNARGGNGSEASILATTEIKLMLFQAAIWVQTDPANRFDLHRYAG